MKLIEALDIDEERIIAWWELGQDHQLVFTGQELAALGRKVVLATTAKPYPPPPGQIPLSWRVKPVLWKEGSPLPLPKQIRSWWARDWRRAK